MSSTPLKSPARQPQTTSINPFAAALAETEKQSYTDSPDTSKDTNPFGEALARTGGNIPQFNQLQNQERQQALAREQQQKERLRKKLHDQINPVEKIDIFNAREKQVKQEIEQLRAEVKLLIGEVKIFAREIDIETQKATVDPGFEGKYHLTFFQQLRLFISLLRQRVRSASTWATQLNGKRGKRKRSGPGMDMGTGHEKTSTVHDMMHNERQATYSGG